MKGKMKKRLFSILLSAALVITGLDVTTVSAAEESVRTEQIFSNQEPETMQQTAMQESDNTQLPEETAEEETTAKLQTDPESETETVTEDQTEKDTTTNSESESTETMTESQTEEETTTQQTEGSSSEQQTEENTSESQTETESSETEQESETLTEEQTTETTEETTETITEEETTELTTEELQTSDASELQFDIYVNPLYKDIIDPDELAKQLNSLQVKSQSSVKSTRQSFQTFDQAADYLREQMVARETTVVVQVPSSVSEANKGTEGFHKTLLDAALAHTEECSGQEGDALKWQYGGAKMSMSSSSTSYTVTYTISYYTTSAQEQELTTKINEALDSLALSGKTDYQKVKAIHDYICDTTDYDYKNLDDDNYKVKFTAYGALCTGKAVCQGYAVAFYRMCKEAGLPVRIITGTGNGGPHAWNIVKIGSNSRASGAYYNIDCTWDGQEAETYYTYFLLNEKDFVKHTRDAEYNTSAFHAQYPMSETSYVDESSLPDGINKENPSATFTTIDDQTVSSAADGKPKIVIFFRTTCTNSQSTIRAIAGHDFGNVDIYAAEIDGRSKDDVINFKKTYGSDSITFAYSAYGINSQTLFYYMQAAGLTNGNQYSASLPVLCYIDANNMFQHITQGIQNASQIQTNLKNYCSAPLVKQYKITYELDGGTNHSENPTVFKENTETITLKDPTKSGFTFAGWYLDAAFTQKITEIEQGTTRDMTLYAKWSTSGAADKLNLDNPTYTFDTLDDEIMITSTANGKPKVLIFFSYVCGKSQQTIRDIATNGVPNADIYALETNKASLEAVQSFKATYGLGKDTIIYSPDPYGFRNNNAANDYVNLTKYNDFAPPIICYIDANNKFQHITFGTSSASAIRNNIALYCNGTTNEDPAPSDTYTITYELDGGTNNSNNPDTYTFQTDTIILQNPTKEGYTFAGWYRDAAFTLPVSRIEKGSSGNLTLYAKWESKTQEPDDDKISISNATITLSEQNFYYNGRNHQPTVTVQCENKTLTLDRDYTISYKNNRDAGTATITITGINQYSGTAQQSFTIQPAKLTITALDKELLEGDPRPAPEEYRYEISGLVDGDKLLALPTFTCNVPDPVKIGEYEIIPSGAKASSNYNTNITYRNGTLKVVKEFTGYKVTFDTQGHGTPPESYNNISVGAVIQEPAPPSAEGYRFEGWYCEPECKTAWNFDTNSVQSNITLYAKWSVSLSDISTFRIQDVVDMEYTGKACKPTVSVYDGDTLLKLNKDYTVKYKNNIGANNKKGDGIGSNYSDDLPSITITGKGNYGGEELSVNFTIQKAKIADANKNPTKGVTLKYTDQLVTPTKAVNPFGSLKYGKALKKDTDFTLSLTKLNEANQPAQTLSNAEIPAGTSGKFLLAITGNGNYEGTIEKTIYVADKSNLLKNAKITLGANIKNQKFSNANSDKKVVLPAGYKEGNTYYKVDENNNRLEVTAKDIYLVTCNGTSLMYNKDFDVRYADNDKVGTASMTIVGKGEYVGEKTVSFRITGDAFKANVVTVDGIENKQYTGTPLTQDIDKIKLTYNGKDNSTPLVFRKDYTVSYKKNINKGTATITFTAAEGSIYSGSFSKTFKITAADIDTVLDSSENNDVYEITASYEKAGAKPTVDLKYKGIKLQNGKDYTISYKDNKTVADTNAAKSPKIIIKGKGNFTGSKNIPFTITQGTVSKENVTITPVAYNAKKPNTYKYTPSVKIKVGNSVLKANKDYKIEFKNNDQVSCKAYFENLESKAQNDPPAVIITSVDGSNYKINSEIQIIQIPLPIYQTKLTKNNVYIVVEESVYTGAQLTPSVRVYFADSEHAQALKEVKKEGLTQDEEIKTKGLILLENTDYALSYGANITAGKNKGSVTISGMSPKYGGSITQKFDILKKIIK